MESYKTWKVLKRESQINLKDFEKNIKNKFNWSWLEKDVTSFISINHKLKEEKYFVGDYIRKIDKPGKAICIWCDCEINYGSGGCKRLQEHASTSKHKEV